MLYHLRLIMSLYFQELFNMDQGMTERIPQILFVESSMIPQYCGTRSEGTEKAASTAVKAIASTCPTASVGWFLTTSHEE